MVADGVRKALHEDIGLNHGLVHQVTSSVNHTFFANHNS
jgi:hypothetical protein